MYAGIIDIDQMHHMRNYAQIHDMSELETGNDFGFAKSNLYEDLVILGNQMRSSRLFTEDEIAYHTENGRRNK
jgi:hypothetical protein